MGSGRVMYSAISYIQDMESIKKPANIKKGIYALKIQPKKMEKHRMIANSFFIQSPSN